MPGDNYRKPFTGKRLRSIPRELWEGMIDAAKGTRETDHFTTEADDYIRQGTIFDVRNQSGFDVDEFGILEANLPIITPANNEIEFRQDVAIDAVTPTGAGKFCITLEPIQDGMVGKAIFAGCSVVRLNVTGTLIDDYADSESGNRTALVPLATGCAQILWAESTGTTRWAVVRFPDRAEAADNGVMICPGLGGLPEECDFLGAPVTIINAPVTNNFYTSITVNNFYNTSVTFNVTNNYTTNVYITNIYNTIIRNPGKKGCCGCPPCPPKIKPPHRPWLPPPILRPDPPLPPIGPPPIHRPEPPGFIWPPPVVRPDPPGFVGPPIRIPMPGGGNFPPGWVPPPGYREGGPFVGSPPGMGGMPPHWEPGDPLPMPILCPPPMPGLRDIPLGGAALGGVPGMPLPREIDLTVDVAGILPVANLPATNNFIAAYKTADESVTNSTTLQDDDHLTMTLAANSIYKIEGVLFWTTSSGTTGIKLALDGTVAVDALKAEIKISNSTGNTWSDIARVTAFASAVGTNTGGSNCAFIDGFIDTGATGTLKITWAQNLTDAVNAVTVQIGSWLLVQKLT